MIFRKMFVFTILFLAMSISPLFADETARTGSAFMLRVDPALEIPLAESADHFSFGGGATLTAAFIPGALNFLSFFAQGGYGFHPYSDSRALSSISGAGGVSFNLWLGQSLLIQVFGAGGYNYGMLEMGGETKSGGGLFATGGLDIGYFVTPFLTVGAGAAYKNAFGLYSGVGVKLGASLYLGGGTQPAAAIPAVQPDTGPRPSPLGGVVEGNGPVKISDVKFSQIFPVFYSYYDNNSIGTARLENTLEKPVTDIKVSLNVAQYMDVPKESVTIDTLAPGQTAEIELQALFTEKMLDVTEGLKVAAEIILEYNADGQRYRETTVESIQLEYRNAMTWDDDRKAAAFITARDPRVMSVSKNIAGAANSAGGYNVPTPLQTALALHETMRLYGMNYVIDPNTPYEDLSQDVLRVDTLQFPRETLEYRAGDCDDLSILYCAMLESVGINTAFITVPGHIYIAFSINMNPEEARKTFLRPDDFIFRDGKSWIPFEITALESSFLDAWQQGAKEWRENQSRGQAGFFPVEEAWKVYRPVALPGTSPSVELPSRENILSVYDEQIVKFIDREIYPRVAKLQADIRNSNDSKRHVNRLGVLYARYGLIDRALREFTKVVESEEYVPSLINLGNIYFVQKDMLSSLQHYERALAQDPDNPKVILAAARVNHELENYGTVRNMFAKLKSIDDELAEQFAYLDLRGEEASRAADLSGLKEMILWEDEEDE